jgi:lipopolysaccharide/colanic/teichoic acid biosynthesis glycosyltransferase
MTVPYSHGAARVSAMTSAALETVVAPGIAPAPIAVEHPPLARARFDAAAKRGLDLVVSAAVLFLLLPVIALVALLIRLDSRGPVFFRSRRVGHRGDALPMLKFRKMHNDASGMQLTLDDDERFTRIGLWLAKLKIDELPQFWHVLRGEMSLVGPRPESASFVSRFVDEYNFILSTKPGIIGLSQIAFAEEGRILDDADPVGHYVARILPQKVRMDMLYVARRTIGFDLRILLWAAVAVVMRREVAVRRSDGRMNLRRR